MPMFIPDLFIEEEYMELGNVSTMPKEHKCICLKSEAFIPEASCRYIQIGVPPARVSRPLASHNPCSPSPLGHVAYGLRA
jgi:hypothetical protein